MRTDLWRAIAIVARRLRPVVAGTVRGIVLVTVLVPALVCVLSTAQASAAVPWNAQKDATRANAPANSADANGARELPSLDLQQRLKDVRISNTPEGPLVTVETDTGKVELTATEYVEALRLTNERLASSGFFYKLFNISKPWGFVWISIGFLGQAMFTFRMVLQWWASEKHKRSIVPVGFWWGSLIGGVMLFVYFIWRKDIVGIVGQSTGVFVYGRNLVLIYRGRRIEAEGARTLNDDEVSVRAPRERTT